MTCYSYKLIKVSEDPLLKNVDITIILMMENSKRFKYDPFILNLSKKTVVQYNKGFRACIKPPGIVRSNSDINHAYYTAYNYSKDYNNVLILEEDAEVLYYTKYHYHLIDKYIAGDFKVFSFSTHGVFTKLDDNFYSVDVAHGSHAQIFSKNERINIIKNIELNNFKGDLDTTYLVNNVVVYKHPLIVQLFPETENFNNWNGNKFLNKLGIKLAGVDKNKHGWEIIYIISKIRGKMTYNNILLLIIIIFFILFIYRK